MGKSFIHEMASSFHGAKDRYTATVGRSLMCSYYVGSNLYAASDILTTLKLQPCSFPQPATFWLGRWAVIYVSVKPCIRSTNPCEALSIRIHLPKVATTWSFSLIFIGINRYIDGRVPGKSTLWNICKKYLLRILPVFKSWQLLNGEYEFPSSNLRNGGAYAGLCKDIQNSPPAQPKCCGPWEWTWGNFRGVKMSKVAYRTGTHIITTPQTCTNRCRASASRTLKTRRHFVHKTFDNLHSATTTRSTKIRNSRDFLDPTVQCPAKSPANFWFLWNVLSWQNVDGERLYSRNGV